mgnify:CR=1 FL=1
MAKEEKKKVPVKSEDGLEKTTTHQVAPHYSRKELMEAAISFGVKPEVMAGALKLAGKEEMTKPEAQAAIKKFLGRKV